MFSNGCFGSKIVPRASFGLEIGGIDTEIHEESKHRAQNYRTECSKDNYNKLLSKLKFSELIHLTGGSD